MTVSGLPLQYTKRQIFGEYDSGDYRPVRVCASGEVVVCSGLYVVADIAESGLHVQISGQHVFVESGVHVVADIAESGIGVQIQSGAHVQISGQHVFVESGVYIISDCSISGNLISISGNIVSISGQHLFVESGAFVVVESGLGVSISGQHVFVESGVHVVTSGQPALLHGYHPASGIWVPIAVTLSGCIAMTYCSSGGIFG